MPATRRQPSDTQPQRRPRDAVERLYVYWIVSTALLAVIMLLVAILAHGTAAVQDETIARLSQRVAELEEQVVSLQERAAASHEPGATGPAAEQQLPYAKAVSRILDGADDLIAAASEYLLSEAETVEKPLELAGPATAETTTHSGIPLSDVREWLDGNLSRLYGAGARMPKDIFIPESAKRILKYLRKKMLESFY